MAFLKINSTESKSFNMGRKQEYDDDMVPPLSVIKNNDEWIGSLTNQQHYNHNKSNQWITGNEQDIVVQQTKKQYRPIDTKMGIQQILTSILQKPHGQNLFSPSKVSPKQFIGLILSSSQRLNQFINKLMLLMPQYQSKTIHNIQILILLLKKISQCDYQIIQSKNNIDLKFRSLYADSKKRQIQQLQNKLLQKQSEYAQVINQNQENIDVLKQLISEADKRSQVYSPYSKTNLSPTFSNKKTKTTRFNN